MKERHTYNTVILSALLTFSCSEGQEITPLIRNRETTNLNDLTIPYQPRIIGGSDADVSNYPYFSLLIGASGDWICGGTLIAPNVILGAAHCTQDEDAIVSARIMGQSDSSNEVNIERIEIHPDFDPLNMWNADFALFFLKEDLKLDFVSSLDNIDLPEFPLESGEPLTVIGFGLTEKNTYSDVLRETTINYITQEDCRAIYAPHGIEITDYMLCAQSTQSNKPQDSCNGDSGGPLMHTFNDFTFQVGVVSWGVSCADDYYPAVYSRVSKASDWIASAIHNSEHFDPILAPDFVHNNNETSIDKYEANVECSDVSGWTDIFGDGCDWYADAFGDDDFIYGDDDAVVSGGRCEFWGSCCENNGYTAKMACCACGGGDYTFVTAAPSASPTFDNILTTDFDGSSLHAGNMFDIVVTDKANLLVTDLQVHLFTNGYTPTIEVWYLENDSHVGNEGNENGLWQLHTSTDVTSNGYRIATFLQLDDNGLYLTSSTRHSIYITCINDNKDMVYTIGSERGNVFKSNEYLSILEGSALGYAFQDKDLYQPRVWNGSLIYMVFATSPKPSVIPSLTISPSILVTDFNTPSQQPTKGRSLNESVQPSISPTGQEGSITTAYTGVSEMDGIMFDLVHTNTRNRTIYITEMDLHINSANSIFHIKVFIRFNSSRDGFERRPGGWTEIGAADVLSAGNDHATMLPPGSFDPIELGHGTTHALYLQAPFASYAMQVTSIIGDVWESNEDLELLVGVGKRFDFYKTYHNHAFNGALYYTYSYPEDIVALYQQNSHNNANPPEDTYLSNALEDIPLSSLSRNQISARSYLLVCVCTIYSLLII